MFFEVEVDIQQCRHKLIVIKCILKSSMRISLDNKTQIPKIYKIESEIVLTQVAAK
jgi:hypothetical protein